MEINLEYIVSSKKLMFDSSLITLVMGPNSKKDYFAHYVSWC